MAAFRRFRALIMQFSSYWHETSQKFEGTGSLPERVDVAVIGGGFTGLAAARRLALAGRSVVVLEAQHVGFGASGRNGGHLNNGLAHSYLAAREAFGPEKAQAMYRAFDTGIETIKRLIAEEGIDCDFRIAGKLKLASKPQHMEALSRNFEAIHREVDPDTAFSPRLISPARSVRISSMARCSRRRAR